MTGLVIKDLSAGYRRHSVIDALTLPRLQPGEVTMLLGPNGCGKSTLLRAVAGLNNARGEAWLNAKNLLSLSCADRAKEVVYLPQTLPSGVHLQVLESVLAARRASGGRSMKEDRAQALSLLASLDIAGLAMSYLDALSGGQAQRVGLAQALIRSPSLLLLDEPLSALDLKYQLQVMEIIQRETRARRMVTLMVVHDINLALRHGGQVLMMKDGRLAASGSPPAVITPENLARVYGVRARVEHCSQGQPQVIVDGMLA